MSGSFRTGVRIAMILAGVMLTLPSSARGQYVPVYGGPTYDPAMGTGFSSWSVAVNNAGTAAGSAYKYVGATSKGLRAVRWHAGGGGGATELGNLGTDAGGLTDAEVSALNNAGTAMGYAKQFVGGIDKGRRAVRWGAGDTAAMELANLGTSADGSTWVYTMDVNDAGTAVGDAQKYVGGINKGNRAVRWDAGGTAATELGNLGTDGSGSTSACAYALNDMGTVVGTAGKYVGGISKGQRAVRWDAGGTVATELGDLGTDGSGSTYAWVYAVNAAGTTVGEATKYVGGINKGNRAVRWDAGGTTATELGALGTDGSGSTSAWAVAVNAVGTAVGQVTKYVGGNSKGDRAVRWDAGGTAATELGNLGTQINGYTLTWPRALNDAGTIVGFATKYVGGSYVAECAVLWALDGRALDLNTLIDPASGWTLQKAQAISENGMWIAGDGTFDPDGAGPLAGYMRAWVMQSSHSGDASRDNHVNVDDLGILASNYDTYGGAAWETADFTGDGNVNVDDLGVLASNYDWIGPGGASVPEPATLSVLAMGALGSIRRRR